MHIQLCSFNIITIYPYFSTDVYQFIVEADFDGNLVEEVILYIFDGSALY